MTNQERTLEIKIDTDARILHLLQKGQYAEAEQLSSWVLSIEKESRFEPLFYLGVALQLQAKITSALKIFKVALIFQPKNLNTKYAIASCLEQIGQIDEAFQELLSALELDPKNDATNANLGAISEKRNQPHKALDFYDTALNINPKNFIALMNRGLLLSTVGKKIEGLAHCRNAYKIHPQASGIIFNLTDTLLKSFEYEEALVYCEAGLSLQSRNANFLFEKGLILSCMHQFNLAHTYLAKAQVIDPKVIENILPFLKKLGPNVDISFSPQTIFLDAMQQAQAKCFWRNREEYIQEWKEILSNISSSSQLINNLEFGFIPLSLALSGEERLKLMSGLSSLVEELTWMEGVLPFQPHLAEPKKIKVGYLSSDFRIHPTGLLSRQVFGLHDKEKFEIYAYSTFNPPNKDEVRCTVENSCIFRDVSKMSDREAASLINEDEIDILVDLNGYTTLARNKIMAMRPAPIQVSYLAYLQSMGAPFIDYAILDQTVCPPKFEHYWQEKIARLPNSMYPYDTEISTAPSIKSRKDFGLPESGFVFCCLNTSYKIEPDIFSIWMEVLKAVPDSVLWLLGPDEVTIENLKREATERGVKSERIIFATPLPISEHLARYQLADLFIDTFWYGAHTTGLDAMWQGLPVLCCVGEVPTSRVGASYQYVLEMPEMVAESFEEYQAKAIYYGTNSEALKEVKQKLKEKITTTPLFDTPLTVKHIEKAYQMMWQRYQDGLPPETFDVPDMRVQH